MYFHTFVCVCVRSVEINAVYLLPVCECSTQYYIINFQLINNIHTYEQYKLKEKKREKERNRVKSELKIYEQQNIKNKRNKKKKKCELKS